MQAWQLQRQNLFKEKFCFHAQRETEKERDREREREREREETCACTPSVCYIDRYIYIWIHLDISFSIYVYRETLHAYIYIYAFRRNCCPIFLAETAHFAFFGGKRRRSKDNQKCIVGMFWSPFFLGHF